MPVPEVGASEEFNTAAFNATGEQISNVIQMPQGYFIITEISERKPIDEQEFEKAKENLKKALLEEKKNGVFEQFFAQLKQKAKLADYVSLNLNKNPKLPQ